MMTFSNHSLHCPFTDTSRFSRAPTHPSPSDTCEQTGPNSTEDYPEQRTTTEHDLMTITAVRPEGDCFGVYPLAAQETTAYRLQEEIMEHQPTLSA